MSRKTEPPSPAAPRIHQLRLGPGSAPLAAAEHQSLLESAAQAGIELLASCRNGTCRSCLRRLLSGRVSYRIDWPGLSREEKAEGYVLPCEAYPQSDLMLADDA